MAETTEPVKSTVRGGARAPLSPQPASVPYATGRYRVLIVEDHAILRDGLRSLLASAPGFEVVGEATNGLEAIALVQKYEPHLVLMDISMPKMNGTEAIREIARRYPKTKIVALTVSNSEETFLATVDAGAHSYVLKDTSYVDLMSAIRCTLAGKTYLSPGISRTVLEGYLDSKKKRSAPRTEWEKLTARERQVLKLIAEGQTSRAIADALCISAKTVERHRSNMMEKLDLHSVSALTVFAVKKGLIA
ncbi:MAG TPA: response regulator transcription factor [Candidatus Methanoperedens sp.]|nr:response regulator transcription factor [Candidatus Methanoperedens sp.]